MVESNYLREHYWGEKSCFGRYLVLSRAYVDKIVINLSYNLAKGGFSRTIISCITEPTHHPVIASLTVRETSNVNQKKI